LFHDRPKNQSADSPKPIDSDFSHSDQFD